MLSREYFPPPGFWDFEEWEGDDAFLNLFGTRLEAHLAGDLVVVVEAGVSELFEERGVAPFERGGVSAFERVSIGGCESPFDGEDGPRLDPFVGDLERGGDGFGGGVGLRLVGVFSSGVRLLG